MQIHIDQQCHGYKNGHQLLAGSIKLVREDQDTVDRLSDISGPLRPSEVFAPYLTSYLLPSGAFYVIAKTWQDLDAPRAGCVLTRSLLVRSEMWESLQWIDDIFASIEPINRAAIHAGPLEIETKHKALPPIEAIRGIELVEALFLEDRQPIVVFDEPEAEIVSRRLLTAFWPSLRKSFSVCTYALGPRQIAGRTFDLVFSSHESRSRFARWEGRRVEAGGQKLRPGRHRWSLATARQIFEEPEPSLTRLDSLGVLRKDGRGDESSLRLTLLWNDLVEQSATSPTAILGMLDVLHAQHLSTSEGVYNAQALALRGIELAKRSLPPHEMFDFLSVLLEKMAEEQISLSVLKSLQKSLSTAARIAPREALLFLNSTAGVKYFNSSFVWAGIGDGLADADSVMVNNFDISELAEQMLLRLIADSRRFAGKALSFVASRTSGAWETAVVRALSFPDDRLIAKARRNLLPNLTEPEHVTVLAECLRGVDSRVIARAVKQLWKTTDLNVPEFDGVFVSAARGSVGLNCLRNEILMLPETEQTTRFLAATLHPTNQDMRWLLDQKLLSQARLSGFLLQLLRGARDNELRAIAQDSDIVESIVTLLCLDSDSDVLGKLAYLLVVSDVQVQVLLNSAPRILPFVSGGRRSDLVNASVSRGLKQGSSEDDQILRSLLNDESFTLSPEHLIAHAFSSGMRRDRLSSNITILNTARAAVRRGVLMQIDSLCDRLVRANTTDLTREAIEAWATLISDAGSVNHGGQLRAASMVLSYALALTTRPVSPLIVVTFPIVYHELQEGREAPSFLSFFFFADWDRCKTARKDIVEAFLHSSWPAVDLISAVLPTGDLDRVLRRVAGERGSDGFIRDLRLQLKRLPKNQQAAVRLAIQDVTRKDSSADSDNFPG